jgi:hypothetical protein
MPPLRWIGPHKLRDYLDRLGGIPPADLPPELAGVYVVTERSWSGQPNTAAGALYVVMSGVLRERIGALLGSLFGFHGVYSGRHAGGITLDQVFVRSGPHNALDVWIAWAVVSGGPDDVAATERQLIGGLNPSCNR